MTNQQINISIAEALGKAVEWHDGVPYWLGMWSSVGEGNESFAEFNPAYDLNAMHEAEKVIKINFHLWKCYESFLARIVSGDCGMFHITANQRAEAFLRTLGKWKE